MRIVARTIPAAALAAVVLATCAPAPTVVAGDPSSPATTTSSSSSPSPTRQDPSSSPPGHLPSATPSSPPVTPRSSPPPAFAAGDTDLGDRPAPEGVQPERIRIPAIDVDADVDDMGLNDDGSIEVPEQFADTGWWTHSPRPGRIGASAILGHVDSKTGPAVFFRLTDLEAGDRIHVDGEDGRTLTFAVRAVEQHPKASFPSERVFGATPAPTLRLITCGGAFDSNAGSHLDNVIVFADLVAST